MSSLRYLALFSLILFLPACKGDTAGTWDFGPPDAALGEGLRFLDLVAHEYQVPGDGGPRDIYVDPNDWDGDGLTNDQEKKLGTNPYSKDSDNDGVDDKTEVGDVNNPKDTDKDGKIDALEPDDFDTDKDGIMDSSDQNDDDGPCSTKGADGPPRLFYDVVRGPKQDLHLTQKCSPYKVVGQHLWMTGGSKLSSEPGVKVMFAPASALKLGNTTTTGNLDLKGTVLGLIELTADTATPKKGFWRGILAENGGTLALEHVSISWSGGPTNSADPAASMLVKAATSISLIGCTFDGSTGYGLHAAFTKHSATLFTNFSKNAFSGLVYSAALNINHLGEIQSDNQFSAGSAGGEVHVKDGTVLREGVWKSVGVPYVFKEKTINIDAKLTVQAGATLIFEPGTVFLVGYKGTGGLHAMGTSTSVITFKTVKGSPGSWQGIMLTGGTSTLNNVQIMGGGMTNYESVQSALYLDQPAGVSISGTNISNSSGIGVYYYRYKGDCSAANPDLFTYGVGITGCKFFCLDELNGQGKCMKI